MTARHRPDVTYPFINGAAFATGAGTYSNIDPSTGAPMGEVVNSGEAEVDAAVTAARAAQKAWRATPVVDRARLLVGLSRSILDDEDGLARLEAADTGKPLSQARADVRVCARYFEFYGYAIDSYYGNEIPLGSDYHVISRREPFGVTGHILAWNYPLQLLARAVAPAIATGNCSVVKPADETPRSAVRIAELAVRAGIPAGVVNVVPGVGATTGAALGAHPGLDHMGFVGSTATGSVIARAAADLVRPTVLELGGRSPHVVFADADLDVAAPVIVKTILQNAGQTCSAGSRLLVHRRVKDALLDKVCARMREATLGRWDTDPDVGPLISGNQQDRVQRMVAGASGNVIVGGSVPEHITGGSYFLPTVIDDVDPQSDIAQQEVFGPVLACMSFDSDEEAVALANGTEYALIAAIWTNDFGRAHRLADAIHAGQVFVNSFGAAGGVELPFGGFKRSGYGREKGTEALDAFTQSKTIVFRMSGT